MRPRWAPYHQHSSSKQIEPCKPPKVPAASRRVLLGRPAWDSAAAAHFFIMISNIQHGCMPADVHGNTSSCERELLGAKAAYHGVLCSLPWHHDSRECREKAKYLKAIVSITQWWTSSPGGYAGSLEPDLNEKQSTLPCMTKSHDSWGMHAGLGLLSRQC